MYQVGKREHKHRKLWKRTAWVVALATSVSLFYWVMHVRVTPAQDIHNAPPVSEKYQPAETKMVAFENTYMNLTLPQGWTQKTTESSVDGPKFAYRSAKGDAQLLDMYVDGSPVNMGLNRAIAVGSAGNKVIHESVSDNCITYTEASKKDPRTGLAPAKWQGIDFNCDMANFARAVVGTVSKDGFNYFNATGAVSGTHKYFFTYTDNSINPDYTILYEILDSIRFK